MDDPSAMSAIDAPVELGELLGAEELCELLDTFARFHGVDVTVADATGVLRPPREGDVDRALRAATSGRVRSGTAVTGGVRYQIRPVVHDGDRIGALAVGPYRTPRDSDGGARDSDGGGRDSDGGGGDGGGRDSDGIPAMADARAADLAQHVLSVLDVVIHNAYARHLTQTMHVAAMTETYTELKAKNERLERAVVRMQELDRLKSGFLATMSHELRTPLTSVIGYAEMLVEGLGGPVTSEQRDYLETILSKADHLLELISGILDASLVESGRLPLRREPFAVEGVVDSVVSTFEAQAGKRAIRIDVRRCALPRAVGDSRKVRQTLWNLVNNAIKFTPDGGVITIELGSGTLRRGAGATAEPGVRVMITDSGIGIPSESQSQIFEPFYQVDSSSTREYGGAGLGLTVAKRFVEAQGGSIWVESAPGTGSVFTISLPVAGSVAAAPAVAAAEAGSGPAARATEEPSA